MSTESLDPYALESQWQANERGLNRIAVMPGLDRALHAAATERLEAAQDRIEWQLGFPKASQAGSRRWSGMR